MEILGIRFLGGPNLWADDPVTEVWLDLTALASEGLPELQGVLGQGLRALFGRGGLPRRTGAGDRARQCLWIARAFEWTLLELADAIGQRPAFARTLAAADADVFQVALGREESCVLDACARSALGIIDALRTGAPCDVPAVVAALRDAAARARPSPSAAALLGAARGRGIPVRRTGRVLHLGQGARQRRLLDTETDRAGPAARWAAGDRDLLVTLLGSAGVPCADEEPGAAAHFRVLVAGPRVAATLHWEPSGDDPAGASARDVTDLIHPEVAARAVDAVRTLGLDVAEVRLLADDITRPLEGQGGRVAEVVPAPLLDDYLDAAPACPVAERVLEAVFPPGETGRIPVIAVTGTNGKTTVTRLLAHALTLSGRFVGMTCTDGIYLAGRCIDSDDCAGPKSARLVLMNPQVEAAVLETARGGILREGLGFDLCDLAVVTNIAEGDHLGLGGIATPRQLAEVKQTVVRGVAPWGTAVLNAADPLVTDMGARCRGRVLFFARDAAHPVLAAHRDAGGRVAFVRDGALVLAEGVEELPPIALSRIPLTRGGRIGFHVENVLACAGGLWSLGLPWETLELALESFGSGLDQSPGRFNVLEINGATAVFDYGHNVSALNAMIEALERFPHRRRIAVYSAAGDRRDADMIRQGEILGDGFDQVILYEDHYTRGRLPGEIMSLFRRGLAAGRRVQEVQAIHGWRNAVEAALWIAQPGDLLLVQADRIDETVVYVRERLAADLARRELPLTRAAAATSAGDPLQNMVQA